MVHSIRDFEELQDKILNFIFEAAPAERALGADAAELSLESCLEGEPQQTFQMTFPGASGRWGMIVSASNIARTRSTPTAA